jgi:hypothetical protein
LSQKRRDKERRRAARRQAGERKPSARTVRGLDGKRHLVVHRDALGRTRRLTLAEPLFEDAWQNGVAEAAANTAHGLLLEGRTRDKAAELGRSAMTATSKLAEGLLERSEQKPACHTGCAHCCYQAVGVSAPEALAIYEHLRATLSDAELDAVGRRVRQADDRTRGMSSDERFSPALACPFLEAERCSIYDVRPLACRGQNSLDAAVCERALHDPAARAEHLNGALTVPCFVEPIRAFHAVAAGLQLALSELHGLRMLPLELTAAMRLLFDEPETLPEHWLRGDDSFAPARGGDASSNIQILRLGGKKRT